MSTTLNRVEIQLRTPTELAGGLKPSYEVYLVSEQPDGFGGHARSHRGPLTPTEAEALGFPLDTVMDEVAAHALAEAAALRTTLAGMTGERDQAQVALEAAQEALLALTAERDALIAEMAAETA